jgi:hypothetical protein
MRMASIGKQNGSGIPTDSRFAVPLSTPDSNSISDHQDGQVQGQQQQHERYSQLKRSFSFSAIEEGLAQNSCVDDEKV